MAFNFSPKIVTNGLVLYLDAANLNSYPGSGTTWNDISRGGNTGTLTNGPTYSSANGGSIVFDGIDDYINLGAPTSLTSLFGTSKITVGVWLYLTSNITTQKIVFDSGTNEYIQIDIVNNQPSFMIYSGGYARSPRGTTISLNTWYYFVGTYDNSNVNIYVNGVYNSQTAKSGTIGTDSGNFNIARYPVNNTYNYIGRISCFQIYNRDLNATEILQNYNTTKTRFGLR